MGLCLAKSSHDRAFSAQLGLKVIKSFLWKKVHAEPKRPGDDGDGENVITNVTTIVNMALSHFRKVLEVRCCRAPLLLFSEARVSFGGRSL